MSKETHWIKDDPEMSFKVIRHIKRCLRSGLTYRQARDSLCVTSGISKFGVNRLWAWYTARRPVKQQQPRSRHYCPGCGMRIRRNEFTVRIYDHRTRRIPIHPYCLRVQQLLCNVE